MDFFSWFDDRTLLACFCILLSVFSVMLLSLRALYPRIQGITSVSAGFFLGTLSTMLIVAEGHIPLLLAVGCGESLASLSLILLYRGVLQFCAQPRPRPGFMTHPADPALQHSAARRMPLFYAIGGLAVAGIVYYTVFHNLEAGRVIVLLATAAITRSLMAWTLYRAADGRKHLLVFAGTAAFTAMSATATILLALADPRHAPHELVRMETGTLLFAIVMVVVQGVLYLLLFAGSVTESIHEQAHLDYLTGTLNRRGIEQALGAEASRTGRSGAQFSILLIDIDHFKSINDRWGHAAGDEALRQIARVILGTVRIYDHLGRFGGDEFLLILPQIGGDDALHTAHRICDAVREQCTLPDHSAVSVSIGATISDSPERVEDVIARADEALYEVKRTGRDCAHLRLANPFPASPPLWTHTPSNHKHPSALNESLESLDRAPTSHR